MDKKVIAVVGARPQFIKHAPVELALKDRIHLKSIHTGQHYDKELSGIFFEQLGLSAPDYQLNAGSGSHGYQTGKILADVEAILLGERPDAIIVYGDTNSTLGAALAAVKIHIPVIHIEAGLRSYNRLMPEEINRILTDQISSILFCPNASSVENLFKEGIRNGVHETGDVMKDMIRIAVDKKIIQKRHADKDYVFATIHRPYNTDAKSRLTEILEALNALQLTILFSVHPRTKNLIKSWEIKSSDFPYIEFTDPVDYFESLNLQYNSFCIITDSGGIQKEAYILGKKCITIRSETEWVETTRDGWNTLLFQDLGLLKSVIEKQPSKERAELYGDGHSAEKIADIIVNYLLLNA